MREQIIGLVRVSTESQTVSGNGLEAQRSVIIQFARDNNFELIEIVTEEASGKLPLEERPVLKAALLKAAKLKATLVVSKLDRLSRKASFILNLMETRAKFAVAQFGINADPLILHIYAVMAEKERKMISERTSAALQALKAKGVKLGNPRTLVAAQIKGGATNATKADEFAKKMRPTVERMRRDGMTLAAISEELNHNGTKTARGGLWAKTTLCNMIARW